MVLLLAVSSCFSTCRGESVISQFTASDWLSGTVCRYGFVPLMTCSPLFIHAVPCLLLVLALTYSKPVGIGGACLLPLSISRAHQSALSESPCLPFCPASPSLILLCWLAPSAAP
ncbi:hypothetical protein LI328DRAFT_140784 [Trichoderma asperelloides]|nr:hypothetical protein LI328DRAFT_140784 [Trichoderma asperelloides]